MPLLCPMTLCRSYTVRIAETAAVPTQQDAFARLVLAECPVPLGALLTAYIATKHSGSDTNSTKQCNPHNPNNPIRPITILIFVSLPGLPGQNWGQMAANDVCLQSHDDIMEAVQMKVNSRNPILRAWANITARVK